MPPAIRFGWQNNDVVMDSPFWSLSNDSLGGRLIKEHVDDNGWFLMKLKGIKWVCNSKTDLIDIFELFVFFQTSFVGCVLFLSTIDHFFANCFGHFIFWISNYTCTQWASACILLLTQRLGRDPEFPAKESKSKIPWVSQKPLRIMVHPNTAA